ncbi:hypothetical protein ACFPYN_02935 [Paenisporosarcina macmurdoensis]|uniref:Fur-regulated basic protein FbpA n=1 Tax=Paenisporosarcina macmurdoensis TaxID=212659 RepID=A0ABW1L5I0_9BACL
MYTTQLISKMAKDRFRIEMILELRKAGIITDRLGRSVSSMSYEDVRYLLVLKRARDQ